MPPSIPIKKKFSGFDVLLAFIFVLFTLLTRYLTMYMVDIGGDEINYWVCAKKIYYNLPYQIWDHQTSRFGIIFPVFLVMKILGTYPVNYYIAPIFMSLLDTAFIYIIGKKLHCRESAFLACVLFILFPQMIYDGAQLLPDGFSATYILISAFFLIKYDESENYSAIHLFLASFFWFFAYQTKVTSLFFIPGYYLTIYVFKKRFRDIFIFSLYLLILLFVEFYFYKLIVDLPLGRLSILIPEGPVGPGRFQTEGFWGLFDRYIHLRLYWQVPFYFYIVASFFLLLRYRKQRFIMFVYLSGSFYLGMLFAVKSINPIIPATVFNMRYLTAGAPLMFLVISIFCFELFKSFKKATLTNKKLSLNSYFPQQKYIYPGLIILLSIGVFLQFRDRLASHPVIRLSQYYTLCQEAYDQGIPIVSRPLVAIEKGYRGRGKPGGGAMYACKYLFLLGHIHKPDGSLFWPVYFRLQDRDGQPYYVIHKSLPTGNLTDLQELPGNDCVEPACNHFSLSDFSHVVAGSYHHEVIWVHRPIIFEFHKIHAPKFFGG